MATGCEGDKHTNKKRLKERKKERDREKVKRIERPTWQGRKMVLFFSGSYKIKSKNRALLATKKKKRNTRTSW